MWNDIVMFSDSDIKLLSKVIDPDLYHLFGALNLPFSQIFQKICQKAALIPAPPTKHFGNMSSPPMTVANQLEMQRQLKALADRHKKAKLQELFSKQDELRPFTNTENSKSRQENENAEIEAMKVQFNDLQKEQLKKQITKQFDLRTSKEDGTEKEKEKETESGEKTQSNNLYGYGSDGSGDQKIDTEDVEAMKAEFGKYQKILLQTQIEKSFRLRVPKKKNKTGVDEVFNHSLSSDDEQDDERKKSEQEERDLIESIKQDSEKMNEKYHAMNKMMLRMRSTKMLETTIEPQIKPEHKERFQILLQDIGIINQSITDKLWQNIEDVVGHQKVNNNEDDEDDIVEEILSTPITPRDTKDIAISKLEKENELLQQQIKYMQQQMASLNIEQGQNENDNDNDADDEHIDAYDDGEMLIIN